MKKTLVVIAGICFSASSFAQKQNIQTANNYLGDKDYDKALEYIEKAVNDPSTKDDPKAWFVRGNVYMGLQQDAPTKVASPYREAAKSYMKVAQLKSGYEKDAVNQLLLYCAMSFYNDAAVDYNSKKYDEAIDLAKNAIDIHDMEGGKRFANKSFDTVAAQAKIIQAYSAYYAKKYADAIPVLESLKAGSIGKDASVYLLLADIYRNTGKDQEYMQTLSDGRKAYPENVNLRNEELNYYIRSGQQELLLKKLEEAVAKEPNNVDLMSNLADTYSGMATPKDATGKELPKPANYDTLVKKAEALYMAILKLDPQNVGVNYNTGVMYYNQATDVNRQMNDIKGNSAAEQKKYDQLKLKREAYFTKALPYLETTYATLDSKAGSLNAEDKFTFQSTVIALKEIYVRVNNTAKAEAMKAKLEQIKSK